MSKRFRVRAQVKSRWYYAFWGTATVAVVAGQIYVGTSFVLWQSLLDGLQALEVLIPDAPTIPW